MSASQTSSEHAQVPSPGALETKLEVVVLPVADVDRAKRFYSSLGWRLDADFAHGDDWHVVQMTPPGSTCSVLFGKGFTPAAPGSVQGTFLVVDDVAAARAQLAGSGVDVSEVFHFDGNLLGVGTNDRRLPGPEPDRRSYLSFASFCDPDGNSWMLQEVKDRLPGRGFGLDVATVTNLLQETEQGHGKYEPTAPAHHWSEWYAAYFVARVQGKTPEEAAKEGALHVEQTRERVQT